MFFGCGKAVFYLKLMQQADCRHIISELLFCAANAQSIITSMDNEFKSYHVVSPYTVLAKPVRASGWVNLRYVPSTEFAHADNLYANTQLTVIAETNNWLQVRRNDTGVTGYVMRQYVITMGVGSGY